jgi:hypothetical protein
MSDFNFTVDDLSSSSAMAQKTSDALYAGAEPLKTSYSQYGDANRTLTQRDLQSVLAGDALYRSPNFGLQVSQKTTESSVNSILLAGSNDSASMKIQDPNSPNSGDYLQGASAFHQIVASGSLGQASLSFGLPDYIGTLAASTDPDTSPGGHSDVTYSVDTTKATMGSRLVAFKQDMLPEEAAIYESQIKKLLSLNIIEDFAFAIWKFKTDGTESIQSGWTIYETNSYEERNAPKLDTTKDWSKEAGKTAYLGASLIEMLLQLGDKIYLKGGVGVSRYFKAGNLKPLTDKSGISDHTFGRGIDIEIVGNTSKDAVNVATSLDNYKVALDILLTQLNNMPEYLQPDLIVIHPALETEYGIGQGFESRFVGNKRKRCRWHSNN